MTAMTAMTDEYLAECIVSGQWRCTVEEVQETATRLLQEKRYCHLASPNARGNDARKYAAVQMCGDGEFFKVARVLDVYAPNETKDYGGHPHTAPHERVAVEGIGLLSSASVLRFFRTKTAAQLFEVKDLLRRAKEDLNAEAAAHAEICQRMEEVGRILEGGIRTVARGHDESEKRREKTPRLR